MLGVFGPNGVFFAFLLVISGSFGITRHKSEV